MRELNKEVLYYYKHSKENDPDLKIQGLNLKELEKIAKLNKMTLEQFLDKNKDIMPFSEVNEFGGQFLSDART